MSPYPELSFKCPIKWDEMRGDERERFCEKCQRSVTNLTRLTAAQRAALLASADSERVCVAYYQRLIATPRHPLTLQRRAAAVALVLGLGAVAALLAMAATAVHRTSHTHTTSTDWRDEVVTSYYSARYKVEEWFDEVRVYFGGAPKYRYSMTMGIACAPLPPPTVPAKPALPKASADSTSRDNL